MLIFIISSLIITSSLIVISAKNPIHSILALISVVLGIVFFLISLGAEFLALTFIAVYLGAVTVLFLFVVMMLNLKSAYTKGIFNSFPIGAFIGLVFMFVLYSGILSVPGVSELGRQFSVEYTDWLSIVSNVTNIDVFGALLYTYYAPFLLIVGVILLIAMIGGVVLTKTNYINSDKKRDFIDQQVSRNFENAVFLINDKRGKKSKSS